MPGERQPSRNTLHFTSFPVKSSPVLAAGRDHAPALPFPMEILTPSNYKSGGRKRPRRAGRPCDACRKRKTRCIASGDGAQCVHCRLRGSPCMFQVDPPGRASPSVSTAEPGRDDSTLHTTTSQSNDRVSSAPEPPSPRRPRVCGNLADEGRGVAASTSSVSEPAASCPLTLSQAQSRFAELYGLGSDMEPILMRHRPYDPATQEFTLETHGIRRVLERDPGVLGCPLTFHMVSDEKTLEFDATDCQVDAVETCIRPHGPGLVELFWRHVQPCYPVLHREVFMSNYSRSYRQIPAPLLGAVYLSALRWWAYDPELSIRPVPDSGPLRRLLHQEILSSYHRPKLSSIQAILLLLQCQPEDPLNPDHTYAWGLTCQALAIGQCIGLHQNASDWSIPPWEKNVRKRLSWALYMQDRWTALAYGRPVHIHHEDWTVGELSDSDFSDCDNSGSEDERTSIGTTGKMQYKLMVRLTRILSNVESSFYTARTSVDQDTALLYQRAQPLLEELRAWHQSIPSSLQMDITYQRKLSFHGYLHFSYYGVVISLIRRLIRSTALSPRCSDNQVLSDIRQLALHTAQSAIGFVMDLRPDQLESFWFFITSLSSQERNFWQETLNSYLWNLRTMSKSCEPMRYAVNRLEGAILRGLEHALAVNINEPHDHTVSPVMANNSTQAFEYTDFGDWDLADVNGAFDFLLNAVNLDPNFPMTREDEL
ncbi:hypothetical protein TPAR_02798 [Tolypocladium paradoxum]|uniref:Zn(2)-C6 fungal-type domain-containing protein n=1 Tax=Tolypocladium paradoxum TaxID=94208 RepID=A0A2S4L3I7_9HYPO|nr:hypothetical protein TPAR_02798 [Tolypocladium paradoxum]